MIRIPFKKDKRCCRFIKTYYYLFLLLIFIDGVRAQTSNSYDHNGNLYEEELKGLRIAYNLYNLPYLITNTRKDSVKIIYGANQKKLARMIKLNNEYKWKYHYYSDSIEYSNQYFIEGIYFQEGRINCKEDKFGFEYYLQDPLESNRVLLSDLNNKNKRIDQNDILQTFDYYPFGLAFRNKTHILGSQNLYLYNNKEYIGNLDLNWYNLSLRHYNPVLAKFFVLDPLADHPKQIGLSPYSFVWNNPTIYIDPNGEFPIIPMILKGTAAGVADMLLQASIVYFFDPEVETIGQAFKKVDWWGVATSALQGAIPFGEANRLSPVIVATWDVISNARRVHANGGIYTLEDALRDFISGVLVQEVPSSLDKAASHLDREIKVYREMVAGRKFLKKAENDKDWKNEVEEANKRIFKKIFGEDKEE